MRAYWPGLAVGLVCSKPPVEVVCDVADGASELDPVRTGPRFVKCGQLTDGDAQTVSRLGCDEEPVAKARDH